MSSNARPGWSTSQEQAPLGQENANASVNTFRQTQQQLFGSYPFASATPSTHVARHLSNMTISAVPPSYIQPSYYTPPGNYGNTPMYYAETSRLASATVPQPGPESSFWHASRNDAVRLLGDQSAVNHYASFQSQWNPNPAPTTYQQSAFVQSVTQQIAPFSAYPTPPPAVATFQSSSSSLAGALGPTTDCSPKPQQREERKAMHQYSPSESNAFFDKFLSEKTKELPKPQPTPLRQVAPNNPPPSSSPVPTLSSPDPLLKSVTASPLTPTNSSQLTPQKRKLVGVVLESPTKKAAVSTSPFQSQLTSLPSSPRTPQTSTSSTITKSGNTSTTGHPRMQVIVEVTPQRRLFASPSQQLTNRSIASSDLGGYGSEDEKEYLKRREMLLNGRSTGKKTGERDARAPLEKFTNLLDDVFEAEDNISADVDPSLLPTSFFSQLSTDPSRPLFHPHFMEKLIKSIGKIARPTKRLRLSAGWDANAPGTPRKSGGMAEIDSQMLVRLLKVLERSVRAGEDLDPFGRLVARKVVSGESANLSVSPTKKAKASKRKPESGVGELSRSKSPQVPIEDRSTPVDVDDGDSELTEDDMNKLETILEKAKDSIIAANCCLALLTSDRLPKQLYSEELITACLSAVKNQLTKIIYPFVETPSSDVREFSPLLMRITNRLPKSSAIFQTVQLRHLVGEIFQALSAILPRINNLICADTVAMSDTIVIQGVYIAIGPFFVVESGTEGESRGKKDPSTAIVTSTLGSIGMRGLRLEALSLIRNIFANYEEQRSWIIEEILSSLIKLSDSKQKAGQFRLRDGRSIRTVSALLLQLVQTSSHNVRHEARRIAKARQQQFAMKRQDSAAGDVSGPFLDDIDLEETRIYAGGLEAPTKAAKAVVVFLTQRSGKGKSTKNANEQEYRAIFDNLISDVLSVLFWPEWPAASLLLSIICKYMISSLDDVKSTNNDNNASKAVSLDHLGVIAGRLRANMIKCGRLPGDSKAISESPIKALDEILPACDEQSLDKAIQIHQEISAHLSKRSSEDQAYESARELSAVMWGQELANTLVQLNELLIADDQRESKMHFKRSAIGVKIKNALRDVWKDAPTDVFDNATQDEIMRVDRFSEQIGAIQTLKHAFDPVLNVIIVALDAPPVFVRTKALRALSHILTVDPNVLSNSNVRRAIESHLLDSSPQVREAAVELIGKYMVDSPSVAGDYYQKIAERIADTGLAVRKRVIKLLKTFYSVTEDTSRKIDICTKLVLRMLDEDDTVKDLAIKTLEELWFAQSMPTYSKGQTSDSVAPTERNQLLARVSVIMGVCGNFKDRQSPLEDMLSKIVAGKEGADISALHDRYAELCDAMIDGLVDASDFMNFTVINCIRTVHLFAAAYPPIISANKASTLLPYLKNPTTNEEYITSDYILKIYRMSIPHMPKTAVKFGNDLQLLLQPMVLKPNPHAGLGSLQETVACLCAVVRYLTHDYVRLVALLMSCNLRVQQYLNRPTDNLNAQELRALHVLVLIVSLLGEHFDFDRIRAEQPDLEGQLSSVTKGPIIRYIYECILRLYDKYTENNIRGRLLQCLGFLFRAQPTLMTMEGSATTMDAIFASEEEENKGRLLKLMQEFLLSESFKHSAQEKETQKAKSNTSNIVTNMEELVGNTHGFAESGVSSAVIQRYLQHILDAALSSNSSIQASAVEILNYTVKQGLAHPLLSFPVIVALETSPINNLSSRAVALHTILHHKHSSLLNSGFIIACRKSHEYQCKISKIKGEGSQAVRGYSMQPTPNALLNRWYALVREKRATRQEFLRAVLKVFEVKDISATTQDELNFIRYMAENFASFDYRSQEEVLTVLKVLTRELAETGAQLLERIAPGSLLAQLKSSQRQGSHATPVPEGAPGHAEMTEIQLTTPSSLQTTDLSSLPIDDQLVLLRSSCITGMIMLLKAHLKVIYGLAEDKCQKFVLGKKSAVGDRPAMRKKEVPISWERMPFIVKPMLTREDAEEQKQTFVVVWNEDGATGEPEEDEWE